MLSDGDTDSDNDVAYIGSSSPRRVDVDVDPTSPVFVRASKSTAIEVIDVTDDERGGVSSDAPDFETVFGLRASPARRTRPHDEGEALDDDEEEVLLPSPPRPLQSSSTLLPPPRSPSTNTNALRATASESNVPRPKVRPHHVNLSIAWSYLLTVPEVAQRHPQRSEHFLVCRCGRGLGYRVGSAGGVRVSAQEKIEGEEERGRREEAGRRGEYQCRELRTKAVLVNSQYDSDDGLTSEQRAKERERLKKKADKEAEKQAEREARKLARDTVKVSLLQCVS